MPRTCAIHVVWTTYGTWLPGDARGHWSPLLDFYGRLKRAGHQLNLADPETHRHARSIMKEPAKTLCENDSQIVAGEIGRQLSPGMPGAMWNIHAATIEPTHVHLLFGRLRNDIGTVVGRLKSRTSSVLLHQPENGGRSRIWTAGYWKVFIFDESVIPIVIQYIQEHNLRRGKPAAPFDWITSK
ncbi:MAG: transposase [Planctomycetes bacterium]|nr:transposase [Planctomycetota bacterium]